MQTLVAGAVRAHMSGKLAEASELCRQVLGKDPTNVQASMLLGVLEVKQGRSDAAVALLKKVRQLDPASFQAPLWLSMAYRQMGRSSDATRFAQKAVDLNCKEPQGQAQLGLCLMDERRLPEAEVALRAASAMAPRVLDIQYGLSRCLYRQGRRSEAAETLKKAISQTATADQLTSLARTMLIQGYEAGAVAFAEKAVQLAPGSAMTHAVMARALVENDQAAMATVHLEKAIELNPDDSLIMSRLGAALQGLGRIEEATSCFEKSIALDPDQGYAYFALVHNRRVTEADRALVKRMQTLLERGALPTEQLNFLRLGLGRAYEGLGEYETAIGFYDEANRCEFDSSPVAQNFQPTTYAAPLSNSIRKFTKEFITGGKGLGSSSQLPVFVVGMIRSGTTLVEQILSSHPDVGAAGEQNFWPDNWSEAFDSVGNQLDPFGIRAVADRYCALLRDYAPNAKRVVDKMPINYAGLGVIHLALPQAKIIHIQRNPIDTCFSIWTTPNRLKAEFGHNRENIAFAYEEYQRIMAHWREVLPKSALLEIQYEDLIENREEVTRKMISFLGLPWSAACMKPEENKRSVTTPSVWQVRQPVYNSSLGRWKHFEPWLPEFMRLAPESE